jgi:cytochrome oxidase Cu insertion factor (SCO1/SenC/PrrC family)
MDHMHHHHMEQAQRREAWGGTGADAASCTMRPTAYAVRLGRGVATIQSFACDVSVGGLLVLISLVVGCTQPSPPGVAESSRPAPVAGTVDETAVDVPNLADVPFTLRDQTGAEFSSESLKGRVWMGAIFFANCPGPCFRENQAIADILREIDDPDFMVVSLTCDPANDTPEALATYAARFDADPKRWKFLTGDLKLIEQVGQKVFRLPVELGVHSERGVVFDRQGRLRGGYHLLQQDRVDLLTKLIREVLAEKSSAADAGIVP